MSVVTTADLVLAMDVRAERDVARLRLAGAVTCGLCAASIAVLQPTRIGFAAAVMAALASLGWTVSFMRARRRRSVPTAYTLTLRDAGLELCEGTRTANVAWEDVHAVEVDEDRLVVLVHRRDGAPPLVLEPRYEGTSVYTLCELVAQRVSPTASQTPRET